MNYSLHLFSEILEDLIMNAVCPKLYNPKAFKHLKLAGLLACSILDAFPFRKGTVAFRVIEDTFGAYSSGVCSGFSPDSLFTHHPKNRGDEHQNRRQIY